MELKDYHALPCAPQEACLSSVLESREALTQAVADKRWVDVGGKAREAVANRQSIKNIIVSDYFFIQVAEIQSFMAPVSAALNK